MGKRKIFIDAERTRYPNTGLYVYAQMLGLELSKDRELANKIDFFVMRRALGVVGTALHYRVRHWWDKLFVPFAGHYKVWHTLYQNTKYFPPSASTKVIATIHDLNFLYEEAEQNEEALAHNKLKLQKLVDRAEVVVCISEFVANDVRRTLNVEGKEVRVIYNGTDIAYEKEVSRPAEAPHGEFIFSIGAMGAKKNFKALLPLLQGNTLHLVIAGPTHDKHYASELLAQAAEIGIAERVHLAGSISEDDKIWFYRNCKAFCFVSIAEGFGLPVVEAMYFGRPVFISNLTSLPEIGGDAVYVFDSFEGDHMRGVFNSGLEHYEGDAMPEKARIRRAMFTWENCAREYAALYNRYL